MTVRFRLLGAIEAVVDDEPIELGYAQLRCMLAVLLVEANHPVSVDQLMDRVWAARRLPHHPRRAVQHNMVLLRRMLAPATDVTITRHGPGYQLTTDLDTIDLHRFRTLLDKARGLDDDERAAALFGQAVALWRGEPFAGLDIPWLGALRITLTAQHHAARLDLTDIQLRLGRHTALLAGLADQTTQDPWDERLAGQYLLALYRSGRQADALAHYRHLRHLLANELGADPCPPLQRLHQQILAADPALTAPTPGTTRPARPTTSVPQPVPRHLPAPPQMFTGRTIELAHLDQALDDQADTGDTAVISAIGGTGGIGKTALALHWAHRHLDRFPDGQLHVNLRGFDPSGQPVPAGDALRGLLIGLGADPAALPIELDAQAARYRSLVAGKRMLIVLDNARDVDQVTPLLPGSPTCTVLITSRHHLGALAALHGARLLDLDVLPESDARDLMARCLGPQRLAAQPQAVAELLEVCAGLPLAVRIVAARAAHHPTFPLAVLADELHDVSARLDGLDAGDLRANLRAVLSWSTRALSREAASLFGLLGIAPSPESSLPATASLADLPVGRARTLLRELEHASLVQQHLPGRYRMHDLIRLYATDTAHHDIARDVREAALRRVVDFYLHTAYLADQLLDPYRDPIQLGIAATGCRPLRLGAASAALTWFDTEHACLLAAQRIAAINHWHRVVWNIAWVLVSFHRRRGHFRDLIDVWQAALSAADHLPDPAVTIYIHRAIGTSLAICGRFDEGLMHLHKSIAMAEDTQDVVQLAHNNRALAWLWERRGDNRLALHHATRALDLYRSLAQCPPAWEARALNTAGLTAAKCGDYDTARRYCQEALALNGRLGNRIDEPEMMTTLGLIDQLTGDSRQAIKHYEDAVALHRALGDTAREANAMKALGHPYVALGEHEQARSVWREALRLYQEQGRDAEAISIQRQLDDLGKGGGSADGPDPR